MNTMSATTSSSQRPYYHEDIDFAALGLQDEDFAALLRMNDSRIDWQDPLAVQYAHVPHYTPIHNLTNKSPPDN
jgi:hypothetical protein